MVNKRTHVLMPEDLVRSIDSLVGKGRRSGFITAAAKREVERLELLGTLGEASGSWRDSDHPELKGGAAAWVRKMRRSQPTLRDDARTRS